MVGLAVEPAVGDVDTERAIALMTSRSGLYDWKGEKKGPDGTKAPFTRQCMAAAIAFEIHEILDATPATDSFEVRLDTVGRSAMFTVLVGNDPDEWRRCVYRAEATLPVEQSFCPMQRRHVLKERRV